MCVDVDQCRHHDCTVQDVCDPLVRFDDPQDRESACIGDVCDSAGNATPPDATAAAGADVVAAEEGCDARCGRFETSEPHRAFASLIDRAVWEVLS
jgi:hypothetical protein